MSSKDDVCFVDHEWPGQTTYFLLCKKFLLNEFGVVVSQKEDWVA